MTYKEEKEAWVSNCMGGSIMEVTLIASSCVVSHGLWLALLKSKFISPNGYIAQFLIYVVPALLTQTIAADQTIQVLLGMVCLTLNVIYRLQQTDKTNFQQRVAAATTTGKQSSPPPQQQQQQQQQQNTSQSSHKTYLTVYRAATMILTCIAILAVDFPVFPRRFAKVETFGTSLMDVGVGSFVFSSGVVSYRAYSRRSSFGTVMYRAVRSSLQLLVLGAVRLLLTRGVDYQLHSSEYGLHWNFFVTLGLLPPCVALITSFRKDFAYLGWCILLTYQYLLSQQGLQAWLLEAPRVDLFTANKEGLCSFLGYLAIFLFGLDIGSLLFSTQDRTATTAVAPPSSNKQQLMMPLAVRCGLYWLCLGAWTLTFGADAGLDVSRRMANLPYVVWVIAFNLTLLTALIWIEQQMDVKEADNQGPPLLNDLNANGLATFLVANALTGLVNLTIKTLYASALTSMAILGMYMVLVTLFPWILARYNIRIKL